MTTPFADRHIGLDADAVARMLETVGYQSLDALMAEAVPAAIRTEALDLPEAASEQQAAAELRALAGDDHGFVSRQLTVDLLADADLVLTATRQHRSEAVSRCPKVLRSAFTLRELHRLLVDADLDALPSDPADRVRELVDLARRRRGFVPPAEPGEDDVADPYGGSPQEYAATTRQILPPVELLVDAIAG